MKLAIVSCVVLLALAVLACSKTPKPEPEGTGAQVQDDENRESVNDATKAGIEAAAQWFKLLDGGAYEEAWEQASSHFKTIVDKQDWENQLQEIRGPMAGVIGRNVLAAYAANTMPGFPDGDYVVIRYATRFENRAEAIEKVTAVREEHGVFRVSGYSVE